MIDYEKEVDRIKAKSANETSSDDVDTLLEYVEILKVKMEMYESIIRRGRHIISD